MTNQVQDYVVSPSLSQGPDPILGLFTFGKVGDQKIRQTLIKRHGAKDLYLFFDFSRYIWVATSQAEGEFLHQLKRSQFVPNQVAPSDPKLLNSLLEKKLVRDEQTALTLLHPIDGNIEISSHCNYRCQFCPVAENPLPKRFMPLELFRVAAQRYVEAGVKSICLNHYSEPTLNPQLIEYVRIAVNLGLEMLLITNASRLEAKVTEELVKIGHVNLQVNLPSVQPNEFLQITGWKNLQHVIDNLKFANKMNLPLFITVNQPQNISMWQEWRLKRDFMKKVGLPININKSLQSRSGLLASSDYISNTNHTGRLNGCNRILRQIATNYEGKVFLCCQDYNQKYIMGDLREKSLQEIYASPAAMQLRRWVFGFENAPDDFVCRSCEETTSYQGEIFIGPPVQYPWWTEHRWWMHQWFLRQLLGTYPVEI